ncbi:MAG: homoserine kinase [Vulcanimicrobiaceae bacterium]
MSDNVFSVSAPASSANLGPGFDAVGIALNLRMTARVKPSSRFSLAFVANDAAPTHDGVGDLIISAMHRISEKLPSVTIEIDNRIPLGKGLGSSAAAAALGLAIATRVSHKRVSHKHLGELLCDIEGHPDNALPAIYGGIIIATDATSFLRFAPIPEMRIFVTIPELDFATAKARALLPEQYDRKDVVFASQHAALLGAALASGDLAMLGAAMQDRTHQPYRAEHIPGLANALAIKHRDLFGIALSGAGPSLIAFTRPSANGALSGRIEACFEDAGIPSRTILLRPALRGLRFSSIFGKHT